MIKINKKCAAKSRSCLKNQKGQVAVFVALIFQVLFIFFAMVINVGLIVHDKINLQNSVDLAAYYGASKQAEWLNVIAHNNYQIRQAWKLLTFRYRVLGSLGLLADGQSSGAAYSHPARMAPSEVDAPFPMFSPPLGIGPVVCGPYYDLWEEGRPSGSTQPENKCKRPDFILPPFPNFNLSPVPFVSSLMTGLTQRTNRAREIYENSCNFKGAYSWFAAMSFLMSYRMDQDNRRKVIDQIARNLAGADFLTLDGVPASKGVDTTLRKNLTNGQGGQLVDWVYHNSLSGLEPKSWLGTKPIAPMLLFNKLYGAVNQCQSGLEFVANRDTSRLQSVFNDARFYLNNVPDLDLFIMFSSLGEPDTWALEDDQYHNTLGVEKNPWYMVYYGVKAITKTKQLFMPFSSSIQLEAKGFAKPFGGRIGPWHHKTWLPGTFHSREGTDKVDALLPETIHQSGLGGIVWGDPTLRPNYSRFPGDTIGMDSIRSLSKFNNILSPSNVISIDHLANTYLFYEGSAGDALLWNNQTNSFPPMRSYEISSILPDLFDISYYSIMGSYGRSVLPKLQSPVFKNGMFNGLQLRGDLGFRDDQPNLKNFSILDQFRIAFPENGASPLALPGYYQVKSIFHLLTDWTSHPTEAFVYNDNASIGLCTLPNSDKGDQFDKIASRLPQACVNGGRSGYSVKMVSQEYLKSTNLELGGTGVRGAIANPPPEGW